VAIFIATMGWKIAKKETSEMRDETGTLTAAPELG